MKRQIDRKKILQILSVYLLALVAALIGGNQHSAKAVAQTQIEIGATNTAADNTAENTAAK